MPIYFLIFVSYFPKSSHCGISKSPHSVNDNLTQIVFGVFWILIKYLQKDNLAIFFSRQNMCTDVCVFFEYRKKYDGDFDKSFTIKCNKNKNSCRTNSIEIKGTCCWEIVNCNGDSQDFTCGQNQRTFIPYISKLKTKKCVWKEKGKTWIYN